MLLIPLKYRKELTLLGNGESIVHFIGIGGSGMSGLATILLQQGYHVTGSDLSPGKATSRLIDMGARVFIGHDSTNIGHDVKLVVISTAIKEDNPELVAAREKGLEIIRRGQLLARLMLDRKGIAVAGSHGKTTTSSMISLVFEQGGLDPTIVVGGDVAELGGNAKLGKSEYLVAEADESDGSFLLLSPYIEVITNIEDDHLDYYGSREAIKKAFVEFVEKVPDGGYAVMCV
ncbi:MAG TPA: Mur ligase domain-containing protein, partial [Verrucomicrobiae bacterium]|nr:Mur ligase domain-containing protein [Verrucomicrobiae bacterium]